MSLCRVRYAERLGDCCVLVLSASAECCCALVLCAGAACWCCARSARSAYRVAAHGLHMRSSHKHEIRSFRLGGHMSPSWSPSPRSPRAARVIKAAVTELLCAESGRSSVFSRLSEIPYLTYSRTVIGALLARHQRYIWLKMKSRSRRCANVRTSDQHGGPNQLPRARRPAWALCGGRGPRPEHVGSMHDARWRRSTADDHLTVDGVGDADERCCRQSVCRCSRDRRLPPLACTL